MSNKPWDETVANVTWSEVVRFAPAAGLGVSKRQAKREFVDKMMQRFYAGDLELDNEGALRYLFEQVCDRTDERQGRRSDSLLVETPISELSSLSEEDRDQVTVLGAGNRKSLRFVNSRDLFTMLDIRYQNVEAVVVAHGKWVRRVGVLGPILMNYANFDEALKSGALDGLSEE